MPSRRLQHWYEKTPPDVVAAIHAAGQRQTTPAQSALLDDWVWLDVYGEAHPPIRAELERRRRMPSIRSLGTRQEPGALTVGELEVLELAAQGFTSGETAKAIPLSLGAVKRRRGLAVKKLGARNITHAVAIWIKETYEPGVPREAEESGVRDQDRPVRTEGRAR